MGATRQGRDLGALVAAGRHITDGEIESLVPWLRARMRHAFGAQARYIGADVEELDEAVNFGVMLAAHRYNPARGFRWTTYAYQTVHGLCQNHLRAWRGLPRPYSQRGGGVRQEDLPACLRPPLSLDVSYGRGAPGELLRDELPAEGPDVLTMVLQADLWRLVDLLPAPQPEILRLRYAESLSPREAGRRLGYSVDQVRRMEGRALRTLRALLDGSE